MKLTKSYLFLTCIFGALSSLPLVTPILVYFKFTVLAKFLYFVYSFFCHQFSSRSIILFDYQVAWCARDTGIWLAVFLTFIFVGYDLLPKFSWYWLIPFAIPITLDGGIQTIFTVMNLTPTGTLQFTDNIYISNNFARFATGSFFGIGLGWWLAWQIKNVQKNNDFKEKFVIHKNSFVNKSIKTFLLISLMLLIYVVLVQLWNLTSVYNKPYDWLDSAVKTPQTGFFDRRGNGICPTDASKDPINLRCFLNNE